MYSSSGAELEVNIRVDTRVPRILGPLNPVVTAWVKLSDTQTFERYQWYLLPPPVPPIFPLPLLTTHSTPTLSLPLPSPPLPSSFPPFLPLSLSLLSPFPPPHPLPPPTHSRPSSLPYLPPPPKPRLCNPFLAQAATIVRIPLYGSSLWVG